MTSEEDLLPATALTVAMGFVAGAALTWTTAAMVRRLRRQPVLRDEDIANRAELRMRQLVSRPDAIDITVDDGVVRLSGRVQPDERDRLLTALLTVPGVCRVRNALSTFPTGAA